MKWTEKKKDAYKAVLILMGLYFSLIETLIPKPFPWIKLGFANIATIMGMEKLGIKSGIEINILRIIIQSFMLGTFFTPNFFISFFAGTVSSFIIGVLYMKKDKFSITAISCFGGFSHNLAQLLFVYFILLKNIDLNSRGILMFIMVFCIAGAFTGIVVGIISQKILSRGGNNGEKIFWNRWYKRRSK